MPEINYTVTGIIVLIALCLLVWLVRVNQKDRDALRRSLPGHKLHRKHVKKNHLHW